MFVLASIETAMQFFIDGGFFMLLLVICSVVALTVIILRGTALRREAVLPGIIYDAVEQLEPGSSSEEIGRLKSLVAGDSSALAKIVHIGLQHLQWPKSENVEAVQTRARGELVRLESGLVVLEVIVGIAPLLGLLGTVSGLVNVFAELGVSEGVADPKDIATGIAQALNTTIAGLSVAVPGLIAFSYFSKKVESMAVEMESLVGDLLSKCYYQKIHMPEMPQDDDYPTGGRDLKLT